MKNKSIGIKLKGVKTYEGQQAVLSAWAKNWKDDQTKVIQRLS